MEKDLRKQLHEYFIFFEILRKVCDVTKRDDLKELVLATEKELGPVDILINNAGIMPLTFVKNLRQDEWDNMVYSTTFLLQ